MSKPLVYNPIYANTWKKSLKKIDRQYHQKIDDCVCELCSKENPLELDGVGKIKDPNIKQDFRYKKGNFRIFFNIKNKELQIFLAHVSNRDGNTYKCK